MFERALTRRFDHEASRHHGITLDTEGSSDGTLTRPLIQVARHVGYERTSLQRDTITSQVGSVAEAVVGVIRAEIRRTLLK